MAHSVLRYCLGWIFLHSALLVRCNQVPFKSETKQVLNTEFSDYVDHLRELWDVKGIAMAVVKPGGEVEFGAWGNRTEDGEPMTPETLFGIASCSKAFLSASLGILFDDYAHGRNSTPLPERLRTLDWDTKITDVLPGEWVLQDRWATEKSNFKDILSHTSGMPRHDASYSPSDSTADVLHRLRFLRPAHELRQKFSYNNQMYVVGAHILSNYTGSYIDYATERIFKPLSMNSTTFSPDTAATSGELTQTWSAHGQRVPFWILEEEKEVQAGPGGVISNVVDLSKWVKMLLNNGSKLESGHAGEKELTVGSESIITSIFDLSSRLKKLLNIATKPESNDTVVPKSVFEAVTMSNTIERGQPEAPEFSISGYGMGWFRFSYQGHEVISHSGSIPGLTSHLSFFPDDDFGIVTLLNTGDKNRVALALHYRATEEILGLPHKFSAEEPPSSPVPPGLPNTTTPLPLSAYSGVYTNPGYGTFVLCDPESSSHYCDSILSDFRAVDAAQSYPLPPHTDVPQLFGAWRRVWSSHVRLVHASNNTSRFDIAITALFPEGYGASKTPFEIYETDVYQGQVEFMMNEETKSVTGFGYFGRGDMEGIRDDGISIEDGAIAWFERL